jgi:benzoyl-CoA reductase subunit C
MIFPSTCDVIRNLSGMWQIMFPGKHVHYFDMPQNFSPDLGGRFYEHELRRLIGDLGGLAGRTVTDDDLRGAIAAYNENRRVIDEIDRVRVDAPWQVPASERYLVLRAGCVLPVEEHTAMLRRYLDAVRSGARRRMDMARVAVRGCFCEQPPLDLIRTLERSGCFIVDDDCALGLRWIRGDVAVAGDPVRNLALAFLDRRRRATCPSVYEESGRVGEALVASARAAKAEGVIFAAPSFCDPALLDQPMTMAAVKAAGIPCTAFLYAENTGQFQVIREQAGTFADSIRLS